MILERMKAILVDTGLPKNLWLEIAKTVVYIKNRTPTKAVDGMTPHEAWHGSKPDLSDLRIIGCDAYVHVPKQTRTKLESHAVKGRLVGYAGMNQYKIWVEGRASSSHEMSSLMKAYEACKQTSSIFLRSTMKSSYSPSKGGKNPHSNTARTLTDAEAVGGSRGIGGSGG
jgi:hypothetical protein